MGLEGLAEFLYVYEPYIIRAIAALVVIAVAYFLGKAMPRVIGAVFSRAEAGYIARITDIARVMLYVIAAIVVASIIAPEMIVFSFLVLLIGLALIFMFVDILRNIGLELYIRGRDIVRRGDWIEIDGVGIRVVDLDVTGVIGETPKLERVFIPYTKLLSSVVINRTTPLGILTRVYISVPQSYGVDSAKNMLIESLEPVKEDMATEPEVVFLGLREGVLMFAVEFHIVNYRKLAKLLTAIESEVRKRIPEAVVKA